MIIRDVNLETVCGVMNASNQNLFYKKHHAA